MIEHHWSRGTRSPGEVFVHRRTLALSLVPAASLACLILAGCGGTADAADPPSATVTTTQTTVRTATTTATPPATTVTRTVIATPVTSTVTTTAAPADVGAGAAVGAGADVDVRVPPADPAPAPQPLVASPPSSSYFKNCSEAKAAGAAPLFAGEPGYRSALDRDNDGVACET
jgi:hypothetical protein